METQRAIGAVHRIVCTPEVKATNDENREVLHVITTKTEDRAGDIVDPAGAQLDNFMRGPRSVFVDHDYRIDKIIGRTEEIRIDEGKLWARTRFDSEGLGKAAFNMVRKGFAGAWSIGFRPIEYDARKEKGNIKGFHFRTWELLEYSLVAIPMNPDAVDNVVRNGLIGAEQVGLLFDVESRSAVTPAQDATINTPVASSAEVASVLKTERRLAKRAEALRVERALREMGMEL